MTGLSEEQQRLRERRQLWLNNGAMPPTAPDKPAPTAHPIAELEEIRAERDRLAQRELVAIDQARAAGLSWSRIGQALGKTAASAQQWRAARD